MADKAQAKAEVLNISRKFGFVGDDIMSQIEAWNPAIRRIIEEGMLAKDRLAAHSIKTLAQNIYGSDARFVFELLQNADDNRFTRARANRALPFISFKVHPNRIIVECNEDGFTGNDLSAICAVGESTKSGSHGYIGAKGIGFKSVFIAAWKVYIQSGNFSFFFKHERGDLGLGMVLPVWKDTDEELPQPLTRMTLHLHEIGDKAELQHLRDTIFKQLNDLQQTCLLFLRNLKRIHVSFYGEDGELQSSREFQVGSLDSHRVFLETSSTSREGEVTVEKNHYHVTRNTAYNVSRSNNREIPNTEEGNQASSTTEVILAFPLSEDSEPITEKQQLFAFLPVKMSDFKFIIQSDFDTSANRQDIVTTSRRNADLLNGIADTFVKAVLQFCDHADLCYTWPSFLPSSDDASSSSFWAGLIPKIKSRLSETPVLRSRRRTYLRLIGDVRIVPSDAQDSKGDPLLDDPSLDLYISKGYLARSYSILENYGLKVGDAGEFLDALGFDLNSPASKMKSVSTDTDWHSKIARLFSGYFESNFPTAIKRLKNMPLVPLRSGQWVSSNNSKLYLATTDGIPVPPAINLPVLNPAAVANEDRKSLFIHLGAVEPETATVRSCIFKAYDGSSTQSTLDVTESRAHLHYLYLTHQREKNTQSLLKLKTIRIYSTLKVFINPHIMDFYLPTSHAYGPEVLLQPAIDAPGLAVVFIHPLYLADRPNLPSSSHPTWLKWLQDALGVRSRLRLVSRQGNSLSDTWHYVREHRPEKLLGLLEYLWKYEGLKILATQSLVDEIKKTPAKRLCILHSAGVAGEDEEDEEEEEYEEEEDEEEEDDEEEDDEEEDDEEEDEEEDDKEEDERDTWTLEDTWLPLPHLQTQHLRYMEKGESFPFLMLEDSDTMSPEQISAKWAFLHTTFAVGKDENTVFLLDILKHICLGDWYPEEPIRPQRIVDLYVAIDAKCTAAINREAERKLVRTFVDEGSYLFIPYNSYGWGEWMELGELVWDGPPEMPRLYSVKDRYEKFLEPNSDQMDLLSRFFRQTLSLKVATWKQVTDSIQVFRASYPTGCQLDSVYDFYQYLSSLNIIVFVDDLRKLFQENEMILVLNAGQTGWHKSGDCLWSSTAEIRGKAVLNHHYEDLKSFFVDKLGVQTLTLQMIYDELIQANHQHERTVDDIKNVIWSFNSFLQTQPGVQRRQLDPGPLLTARVFPVKYPGGGKMLVSAAENEFAIIDRDYMATRFEDEIKFLDYTLAEVRQLQPFLEWANLEHRYLSRSVKEITSVSDGALARNVSTTRRDVKRKAHALLRIAATYDSPRYQPDPQDLYRLLRTTQVIETTGISCILTISQNGQAVQVEEPVAGEVHMSEENDMLFIYVPIDNKLQEFCFCSLLPARLADWLMRDSTTQIIGGSGASGGKVDTAMVSALTTLLAVDISAVDLSLNHQGIVQVPVINEDIIEDDDGGHDHDDEEEEQEGEQEQAEVNNDYFNDALSLSSTLAPSTPGTITPTTELDQASPAPFVVHTITHQSHMAAASHHRPRMTTTNYHGSHSAPQPTAYQQSAEDIQYRALLQRVTTAARSAAFPSRGSFDMSDLLNHLPSASTSTNITSFDGLDVINRFRPSNQLERDRKIGAAGELYVFELLSRLLSGPADGQHGFDISNWESTIRRYIADHHPDYADMSVWNGRETADFTFDDAGGLLRSLLRDTGYLDDNSDVDGNAPGQVTKYFIEVKTTSGPCGTPFYMSKGQFQRMGTIHNANVLTGHAREIYMVLRVFDIESNRPGMCVYLDPEQLRLDGGLVFTGETWSVAPGH